MWRPLDPGLGAPVGVVGAAPPGITGALREQLRPGDRLFNPQPWGSWFEFTFPATPVALDSRIELFPPAVWDAYQQVTSGADGWQDQLRRWGVTMAVAAGGDEAGLVERLTGDGWTVTYQDDDGTVLRAPTT